MPSPTGAERTENHMHAAVQRREAVLLVDAAAGALDARDRPLLGRERAAAGREQRARVRRRADEELARDADHPRERLVDVDDRALRVQDHDALLEGGRRARSAALDHRPAPIR